MIFFLKLAQKFQKTNPLKMLTHDEEVTFRQRPKLTVIARLSKGFISISKSSIARRKYTAFSFFPFHSLRDKFDRGGK